jgi:hypothetical protein
MAAVAGSAAAAASTGAGATQVAVEAPAAPIVAPLPGPLWCSRVSHCCLMLLRAQTPIAAHDMFVCLSVCLVCLLHPHAAPANS